jgi:hypothetical protein
MFKFLALGMFPSCMQWFWLMNNLNTKILNAFFVKSMGEVTIPDEEIASDNLIE